MQTLKGVRVLDLSENLAGPYCTQILADLGADVIKIERPGGDPARAWGPPFWGDESAIWLTASRNKRAVVLDLKTADGRDEVNRLLADADVMVQSFRAGVIENLGFGWNDVQQRHPSLIYCTVSAYGPRGPLRDQPGYDPLMQAFAGIMSVTGEAGGAPVRVGTSIVDVGTGMWAALGIMAALRDRERTGAGTHVVVSLFGTALSWMAYHLIGYLATGIVPHAQGTELQAIAPYGAFETQDGRLMIAAANDALFVKLCAALNLPELAEDERFAKNSSRAQNRAELRAAINSAARGYKTKELESRLRDAGIPCSPIHDLADVLAHPQTAATGLLVPAEHSGIPDFRSVAMPIEWNGEIAAIRTPSPPLSVERVDWTWTDLGT